MPDRDRTRPCPVCPACGGGRWRQGWRDPLWRVLVCRGCGLGRIWPMPSPQELAAVYSERYFQENYLASKASRLDHFRRLWVAAEALASREGGISPQSSDRRLLDVGCGPGFFLEVASTRGWQAWGVEPSPAAAHVPPALRAHVIRSRFGEDHLQEGTFDVVTFWDVLAHLPDPAGALARAARLLRGGGWVVIKTPMRSRATLWAARLAGRYGRALLHLPQQVYHFTPAAVRLLCGACGFDDPRLGGTGEAAGGVPPAPTLRRTLARRSVRLLERMLNPRPAILAVARAHPRSDAVLRAAGA